MRLILILLLICSTLSLSAQDETREVWHDGEIRSYLLHLPDAYDGESGLPLVINMHGFGSNATEQQIYTRFNSLSDQNNFIVVYPQGLPAEIPIGEGNHWNAGFGTGVDDTGFLDKLIDLLWNEFKIDLSRVYATGMSNGGYMSYTLACELSGRIAAIASVTGSMTTLQETSCNGEYVVPVLQFHGTADPVVNYEGDENYLSIPDLMEFWADKQGCVPEINEEDLPDTRPEDGSSVTIVSYSDCNDVILYRINNGGHTWPNGAVDLPEAGSTNRDINASSIIWNFFSQYAHPDPQPGRVITSVEPVAREGRIFPTLFDSYIILRDLSGAHIMLMDRTGKVWKEERITSEIHTWNLNALSSGLYLIRVQFPDRKTETVKVVKL